MPATCGVGVSPTMQCVDCDSDAGRCLLDRRATAVAPFRTIRFDCRSCIHLFTFGDVPIILVGDLGQLLAIEDWIVCDTEATFQ